jgi:cytochrome subunit of sulfide dehydrogenase
VVGWLVVSAGEPIACRTNALSRRHAIWTRSRTFGDTRISTLDYSKTAVARAVGTSAWLAPQSAPHPAEETPMPVRPFMAATALALASPCGFAQDAVLARSLAATCANCHGTFGQARGDMKPLAGVAAEKILAQLADFRSGAQPATVMHQIAKGYSDDQLRLIAGFFSAQKGPK